MSAAEDLLKEVGPRKFATVLADPPWQFQNRTSKKIGRAPSELQSRTYLVCRLLLEKKKS